MTASRFSVSQVRVGVGVLVLGLAGCDDSRPARFALPTEPTAPPIAGAPPAPSPSPSPGYPVPPFSIRFGPLVYTPLEVGAAVRGPLVDPPECVGFAYWPCAYFQLTARESGTLVAVLTYSFATQGSQGVDVSVKEVDGRTEQWAQYATPTETRVEVSITAGRTYHLILWYAFNGLEFELATALKPE